MKKQQYNHRTKQYLASVEDIFFNFSPDFLKLAVESYSYDPRYEYSARRKELDIIYFIDEILTYENLGPARSFYPLCQLEELVTSADFFRDALVACPQISYSIVRLKNSVQNDLQLISDISESRYKDMVERHLTASSLPSSKKLFLAEASKLIALLDQKANALQKLENHSSWRKVRNMISFQSLRPQTI